MNKNASSNTIELTSKQRKIITKLLDDLEVVSEYNGYSFKRICDFEKKDPKFIERIFSDFRKSVLQAIRADLHVHPLTPPDVKDVLLNWLHTHQALGNKLLLRKTKRGLEVGVKHPLNKERAELKIAIEELRLCRNFTRDIDNSCNQDNASTLKEILDKIRLNSVYDPDNPPPANKKPRSWSQVHRTLVRRGIIKTSRQFFLRKTRRLSPSLFPRPKEPKDQSKKK